MIKLHQHWLNQDPLHSLLDRDPTNKIKGDWKLKSGNSLRKMTCSGYLKRDTHQSQNSILTLQVDSDFRANVIAGQHRDSNAKICLKGCQGTLCGNRIVSNVYFAISIMLMVISAVRLLKDTIHPILKLQRGSPDDSLPGNIWVLFDLRFLILARLNQPFLWTKRVLNMTYTFL